VGVQQLCNYLKDTSPFWEVTILGSNHFGKIVGGSTKERKRLTFAKNMNQ
jgi:hypothetical protein